MNPAPTKSAPADPIDAVVTWVDGNDPAHRAKREAALKALGRSPNRSGSLIPAGKDPTRFTDNGEIRWCLHSIRKFAPWIRHIHLVTDNQVPAFLTAEKQKELGVRIVDHTEIFRGYEWALPTFNPYAIETVLWRIDALAESFLFFNDDFILIRPVRAKDFFDSGQVVLRGKWQRIRGETQLHRWAHSLLNHILRRVFRISRTMQLHAQMNGAKLVGFRERHFRSPHVPHPLRQSTFREFFGQNQDALKTNLQNLFRSAEDFVPVSLANHLEIRKDAARLLEYRDTSMFSGEYGPKKTARRLLHHLDHKPTPFLCLQSFERFEEGLQEQVQAELNHLLDA